MPTIALLVLLLLSVASPAWAGSYTVTADDAAVAALAAQAKLTPEQALQRIVDHAFSARQHAEMNRALSEVQRSCRTGEVKACAALQATINAAKGGK